MAKAGVDLGTTYSAMCIYDEVNRRVDFVHFDTCTRNFFPTLIAYQKEKPSVRFVGEAARRYRFSKRYDVYDTFKLSMGEGAHETGNRQKSPFQVAQDYVGMVLEKVSASRNISLEDLVLVQTVPDIWKNEIHNKIALNNLTELYNGLNLGLNSCVSFESEPVSAVVYYLNEICRGEYSGYIMVVDYGGGTLDLTLCRAEENGSISVLFSCGNGGKDGAGCAGNAFDRAVTLRLVKKYGMDQAVYAPGTSAFGSLQSAFEDCKIAATENTRAALISYYESGGFDDQVAFSVVMPQDDEEYDVYASDIAQSFDLVNRQVLCSSVREMQNRCKANGIDIQDIESFRVLMVGGYSNLYCVENCVRELFSSATGIDDLRFDARMNRASRSTAIAHGACLIAAQITPVVYMNQTEAGFFARNIQGENVTVPVLERGEPVKNYMEPRFSPYTFRRVFQEMPVSLTLYFDDGSGPVKMVMDEMFQSLCPNQDKKDNRYQIGFSIDRHRIPQLHIRDDSGAENVVSLYKTIAKLPAIIIQEDI